MRESICKIKVIAIVYVVKNKQYSRICVFFAMKWVCLITSIYFVYSRKR